MSDVRYGVIGTGMMGVEHIENLNLVDGAQVTAIADPHAESLAAGADAAEGEVGIFTDHRAMLDADVCDAIVIATPNMTHLRILEDVLPTDLHVLVEKPMCTNIADCRRVVELTADRSALTWVGLEYRYMPPIARLLDEVGSGAVGEVRMVAIREHRFPFLTKVDDWNRFTQNTGGTLVEKCCHYFHLMTEIVRARPVRVIASGAQDVNHLDEFYGGRRADILDNAYVIVEYEGGVRAMLDLCMFADATYNQEELSVVGTTGKVEAFLPEDVVRLGRRGEHFIGDVEMVRVDDDRIRHVGLHHGSSYLEHVAFLEAVRSGSPPEVDVADGLLSVAVGIAGHRSIDEGRPVSLDEILDR